MLTSMLPTVVTPFSEISGQQKHYQHLPLFDGGIFSAHLPILSTYQTIANDWLKAMSSYCTLVVAILSLIVGPLPALVIDYFSLVIGSITITNEVPLLRTVRFPCTREPVFNHSFTPYVTGIADAL